MEHDWADLSVLDESSAFIRTYAADYPLDSRLTVPERCHFAERQSVPRGNCREAAQSLFRFRAAALSTPVSFRQLVKNGIQSVCCVPFTTSKGLVGSFNLGSVKRHAFQSEDFDLLKQVGLQLANAIDTFVGTAGNLPATAPGGLPGKGAKPDPWPILRKLSAIVRH